MELKQWLNVATPLARSIARKIIHDAYPEPLHTHRIFSLSQTVALTPEQQEEETARNARLLRRTGPGMPPNPTHPIRSLRYLKTVILEDLCQRDEIVKIVHQRPPTPEEIQLAARTKPPTRSQRKNRGAGGPGKRPVRIKDGLVTEWVWRLKTPEDGERERLENIAKLHKKSLEKKLKTEAKFEAARLKDERRKSHMGRQEMMRKWESDQRDYFLPGLYKRT